MKFENANARIFIPDNDKEEHALAKTTHLAVSAHQDDIEFMAYAPIAACFGKRDLWFTGVVVTDGAGSPRSGIYADCSDEDMKAIRIEEQKKAAYVGGYSAQLLLSHPSSAVKEKEDGAHVAAELAEIFCAARPRYVYMHNLADKHETHVATALKTLAALRSLPKKNAPKSCSAVKCGAIWIGCATRRKSFWIRAPIRIWRARFRACSTARSPAESATNLPPRGAGSPMQRFPQTMPAIPMRA